MTALIGKHNQQDDQSIHRALSNAYRKALGGVVREVVAICNYGNLYFLQFWRKSPKGTRTPNALGGGQGGDVFQRADWISKTSVYKKYKELDMREISVRDGVLDEFRHKLKEDLLANGG